MRVVRLVYGLAFAAACVVPRVATTQDTAVELAPAAAPSDDAVRRAIELAAEGRSRYAEGDITGAIVAYEQAFDLSRDPAFAYNLGALYEAVGEVPRARAFLAAYLELYPEAPNHVAISDAVARLDALLASEWAQVRLVADVERADVLELRGEREFRVGSTPFTRWVAPGSRTYRLRADGYIARTVTVEATVGQPVERSVSLPPSEYRLRRILQRCERGAELERCAAPE